MRIYQPHPKPLYCVAILLLFHLPIHASGINKATLIPDIKKLNLVKRHGRLQVIVPKFQCHCAISFQY